MDLITGTLIYFVAFWIGAIVSLDSTCAKHKRDDSFRRLWDAILLIHGISIIVLFIILLMKGILSL